MKLVLILAIFCLALMMVVTGQSVCSLKPEVGPCRATKRRFYFNSKTKKCETFNYGGCDGNGNNFNNKEDCIKACL